MLRANVVVSLPQGRWMALFGARYRPVIAATIRAAKVSESPPEMMRTQAFPSTLLPVSVGNFSTLKLL